MMGLGPTPMVSGAGGNLSSSTSNLSALAPPFTVDRLNPKPNSNPNLHYPDLPYSAEPYGHGWQYPAPSAPIPELVFESTGINNVPLSDDYRYSPLSAISPASSTHWPAANKAPASAFAYGGEVKPYYSPYVPPLVGEASLLAEDEATRYSVGPTSGKSQTDYSSSLFDVDYRAAWVDDLGFDGYRNRLDQGGFGSEKSKRKSTQDSGVSYQKLNQMSGKEVHTGSSTSIAQMEDKSCHEQNFGLFPCDSNKTQTSAYISTYPEPYHSALASDTHKNFSNGQNPFENFVKPFDTPFIGPVSATLPSPTVVIRPPPVTNGKFTQRTFSRKPARFDNIEKSAQSFDFGPNPNSQIKEDPFDRKIKARYGSSQLPDLDIIDGFSMGCDNNNNSSNIQLVNSTENCSDFIDHHSTSVDSPCWKGASSSQFSPFDIEAGESNKNIGNEYDAIFSSKGNSVNESKTGGFDMGILDTKSLVSEGVKMSLNDVSEGAVAVHAAEKVLASPASQEDVSERIVIMPKDRKLNVQTVLKTIHNLSELLLFHFSSDDACSLEEENTETLRKAISNLDSCLNNKITEASKMTEPINSVGDDSDKLRKSRELGTNLGSPHTTNEAPNSQINLDFQHMHEEERSYSFSGKKDEKSPVFSPLVDDLDITIDDDMTKAIKKVLEENFQPNEEMPSEALLFKNLWLDTEAKLCTITYKARFDRMKIQMEQFQIKAPQDNDDIEETKSEVCLSPGRIAASELGSKGYDGPIPKPTLQNISISSMSAGSIEASVMARFNILKSREDNAKPINPEMVDGECEGSNIMAKLNILRLRDENLKSIRDEKQSKMMTDVYATLDEFHLSVPNDPVGAAFPSALTAYSYLTFLTMFPDGLLFPKTGSLERTSIYISSHQLPSERQPLSQVTAQLQAADSRAGVSQPQANPLSGTDQSYPLTVQAIDPSFSFAFCERTLYARGSTPLAITHFQEFLRSDWEISIHFRLISFGRVRFGCNVGPQISILKQNVPGTNLGYPSGKDSTTTNSSCKKSPSNVVAADSFSSPPKEGDLPLRVLNSFDSKREAGKFPLKNKISTTNSFGVLENVEDSRGSCSQAVYKFGALDSLIVALENHAAGNACEHPVGVSYSSSTADEMANLKLMAL
ncbi:hypothetical protein PHJA_001017500 [Phtheirospermum japonicum]|uniref:Uncharacterized protein n=1 Tax=Phtheirospermum japonicum TaxID=374723 RepID=A0A830BUV4_9LAMI|nr:hypothetical protein PHJA_001017500 [Phtheirospermum japonicum]